MGAVVKIRRMRPSQSAARSRRLGRWWLDQSVRTKGMIVVAIPLIALVAVSTANLALQHSERQERAVALVASNLNTAAQNVLTDAVDAETGVRGYVATRDMVFLQPYQFAVARLPGDRAVLRATAAAQGDAGAERVVEATAIRATAQLSALRAA